MVSLKETEVQGSNTNINVQICTCSGPICQVSGKKALCNETLQCRFLNLFRGLYLVRFKILISTYQTEALEGQWIFCLLNSHPIQFVMISGLISCVHVLWREDTACWDTVHVTETGVLCKLVNPLHPSRDLKNGREWDSLCRSVGPIVGYPKMTNL